jgi:hypothetical protein
MNLQLGVIFVLPAQLRLASLVDFLALHITASH